MSNLNKASVQAILTDALAVIDAANVTGDLRPVALGKAIDLLSGVSAARARDSIPSPDEKVPQPFAGDARLAAIAKRMSIDAGPLVYIYEFGDDDVTMVVPRSKLGTDKKSATSELAVLYAAARQAGGYDESHTMGSEIRECVSDMGVLDVKNFASTLSGMRDVFAMKGSGKKREFKLTQHGYEEAGKLVDRLNGKE